MDELPLRSGPFVFDSSALIDIERGGRVNDLPTPGSHYLVPRLVKKELERLKTYPLYKWVKQKGANFLPYLPEEHSIFFNLINQKDIKVHDGEATAIAMAINRKGTLVISEGPGRTKSMNHGVTCIDGNEFLNLLKPRLFQ